MTTSNDGKKRRDRRLRNSQKANDRKIDNLLSRGTEHPPVAVDPIAEEPQNANEALRNRLRKDPVDAMKPKVAARAKPLRPQR